MNLSLTQRLYLFAKAVTGSWDLKPGSAGYQLLKGAFPGAVGAPPVRGTQAHLQGYTTLPWVRAVASRVGHAVAAAQWKLFAAAQAPPTEGLKTKWLRRRSLQLSKDPAHRKSVLTQMAEEGTLRKIDEHPLLDLLNEGNLMHSGNAIRKMSSIHRDLVGETFWLLDRGTLKQPTAMWPIAPHWVLSTPTPTHPFFRVGYRGWQGWLKQEDLLWFKDPDPAMPYWRGSGTSQALSDEMETDEYASKYLKQFFYNSARPDVIISPGGEGNPTLNPAEMDRLEQQWNDQHQGFWRAFKPLFANRKLDVTVLEANFRQLQMKDLRQHMRDIALQVWGVPPEILGVLENSNRATIDAADYLFSKWVVQPRLEDWRIDFQRLLVPLYDDRLILDYVSPVQDDRAFAADVVKALPWAFTADEVRELVGKAPLEDEQGGFHMEPTLLQRVNDWSPVEEPAAPPPLPAVPGGPPGTTLPQAAAFRGRKYSEDQPHDDAGRWTDSGGGGGGDGGESGGGSSSGPPSHSYGGKTGSGLVRVAANGRVTVSRPKSYEEANGQLDAMNRLMQKATADVERGGDERARVYAALRLRHVQAQLARTLTFARQLGKLGKDALHELEQLVARLIARWGVEPADDPDIEPSWELDDEKSCAFWSDEDLLAYVLAEVKKESAAQ